jgi:hypothetical protein
MKSLKLIAVALCSTLALAVITEASAADIRIRCEKRDHRSKISVDGGNLASGEYKARVISGDNAKTSPSKPTIGDEVEFDFDSARADIAAGATAIAPDFIQGGQVTAKIIGPNGRAVASDTEVCRVR